MVRMMTLYVWDSDGRLKITPVCIWLNIDQSETLWLGFNMAHKSDTVTQILIDHLWCLLCLFTSRACFCFKKKKKKKRLKAYPVECCVHWQLCLAHEMARGPRSLSKMTKLREWHKIQRIFKVHLAQPRSGWDNFTYSMNRAPHRHWLWTLTQQ